VIENYPCKDCLIITQCTKLCERVLTIVTDIKFRFVENKVTCGYCGSMMTEDPTGEYVKACTLCTHRIMW